MKANFKIGLNAYGLRFILGKGILEAMDTIHSCGFESFEPMINVDKPGMNQNPKYPNMVWDVDYLIENYKRIQDRGIHIKSAYLAYSKDTDIDSFVNGINRMSSIGIKFFVFSDPKLQDFETCNELAKTINTIIDKLNNSNVELLYHPHENEFIEIDGKLVIDHLLEECPKLCLEPDIGWIHFANINPKEYMLKHSNRIRIIHFKDLIESFGPENRRNSFTAIGNGVVDVKGVIEILDSFKLNDCSCIICQDNSNDDYLTDLKNGVQFLKKELEGNNENGN